MQLYFDLLDIHLKQNTAWYIFIIGGVVCLNIWQNNTI